MIVQNMKKKMINIYKECYNIFNRKTNGDIAREYYTEYGKKWIEEMTEKTKQIE